MRFIMLHSLFVKYICIQGYSCLISSLWYPGNRGSAAPVQGLSEQLPQPQISRSAALVHEMLLL